MSINFTLWIIPVLSFTLLTACAKPADDFYGRKPRTDRSLDLDAKTRAETLVNELFQAVYDGEQDLVLHLLKSRPDLALATNTKGDTAFGLALQLESELLANRMASQLPAQELFHRNKAGEGYIFLAAKAGFAQVIATIADRHYYSLGAGQSYDFADLDQKNELGQRALFVAANRLVAQALETQYYRGLISYPFWNFMMAEDKQSRSFLHMAANDGRDDVILWTADRLCAQGSWEKSESWWLSWPTYGAIHAWRGLQTNLIGDWGLPVDLIFNRADNDYQTALQKALLNRRWSTVRALSHCRWLDFDLTDVHGDNAIHTFIKSLNPYQKNLESEVHETLSFLLAQFTRVRFRGPAARVNRANHAGDTPLHLAARLADPAIYRSLARKGNVFAHDKQGRSPESIFRARRQDVR